jgi:hypothetical protein
LQIIDTILEARTHESREKFILEAYNAWQIVEVVKGIMSEKAKGTNFADYMKKLGLNEPPPKDERAEKIAAAFKEQQKIKALSIADQIKQADLTAKQGK